MAHGLIGLQLLGDLLYTAHDGGMILPAEGLSDGLERRIGHCARRVEA